MEKIKALPILRRFGFRVFLYNAILLIASVCSLWIIRKGEYKHLMDRVEYQRAMFEHTFAAFEFLPAAEWDLSTVAQVLPQHRYILFKEDGSVQKMSNILPNPTPQINYRLIFPHPYVPLGDAVNFEIAQLVDTLRENLNFSELDFKRTQQRILNVATDGGLDRIVVIAKALTGSEERNHILVSSASVVDILMQTRGVKERFLLLFCGLGILAISLTFILSRSVIWPFRKLHSYAVDIQSGVRNPTADFPQKGELSVICNALQYQIQLQQKSMENFRQFSTDIAHELKTPLSAIRSGLEVYESSDDAQEKARIFDRIQRRLSHMAGLLDDINHLGTLESSSEDEYCDSVILVAREIADEFAEYTIELELPKRMDGIPLPISEKKLYQLVRNVCENAMSFSPAQGSVTISVLLQKDSCCISVSDRGPGIPEHIVPLITNRFFSFRPAEHGTGHSGLGLAIATAILSACGGNLSYQQRTGGGSVFTAEIPLCPRQ